MRAESPMSKATSTLLAAIFAVATANPAVARSCGGDDGLYVNPITDPAQVAERVRTLQAELKKAGIQGVIRSCQLMTDLAVGVRDGDNSYGAICKLRQGSKAHVVFICDDDMVGHLTVGFDGVISQDYVVGFVRNNCTGS
jgi:hypothetical protein